MSKTTSAIVERLIAGYEKPSRNVLAKAIAYRMRENNPRLFMRMEAEASFCATPLLNLEENIANMAWKKLPTSLKKRVDVKKLQKFLATLDAGSSFDTAASAAKLTPALGADLMVALEKTNLL